MLQPPQPDKLPRDHTEDDRAGASAAVGSVTEGHQAYVALLFNKYRTSVHRYLTRLVPADDAAELVQETYFRLLRHGELVRVEAMARAFLFQTAANLARDLRRRRASHRTDQHVQLDEHDVAEEHQGPDEHLAGEQARALLERAIANLPLDTRTVFLLHRFRDLSYPQIAQITRLSVRTISRKMAEAIEQLTTALGPAI